MPETLIACLAAICADAREQSKMDFLDIQFAFPRDDRPRTVKTIERFERGQTWPNDPQATVAAYSQATGIPAWELWQMAINDWKAALAKGDAAAGPPPDLPGPTRQAKGKRA